MNTCTRCQDNTHLDFPSGRTACNGCDRSPSYCRCAPVKVERVPMWLMRSRERVGGLARDMTAVA